MDDRARVVDRVAEALFCQGRNVAADTMRLWAEMCYDQALVFWGERERRRGEWQRQLESEHPLDVQHHPFEPAQGSPDTCLTCSKRRALHFEEKP